MGRPTTTAEGFWDRPLHELFELLPATPAGLTTEEARRRLRLYGPNSLIHESRFAALLSFLGFFRNPLVVILVIASGLSLALGEHVGGLIILAIVLFSVLLNFLMEFQARHAVEDIQKQIALTAAVVRDGREQELPTAELVPGDVVRLNAGDLVPADARLLEVKDLHVRESVLTGESLPVEKTVADLPKEKHGVADATNSDGVTQPFDESRRAEAEDTLKKLSADGFRVLGVATAKVEKQNAYAVAAEHAMTLVGFAAFLDPPKEGVLAVLEALKQDGISVVVMTGDNQYVTQKIAHDVGLDADRILVGNQLDAMDDAAVAYQAENGAIFARVSPEQKSRVILALKARGHVVGYMGDGINDAPSLHTADVGISVMNGVNVAKDAAKIILLEKDLAVVNEGVLEGRRSFANIMKYIIMGTSSNFGNMFSMAAASLFLPFLPMLPSQILLNNFLYDVSQVSIPTDNVDPAMVQKPKRWQIGFIRQFMAIIGPISSIYDFLTFGVLLWVFHASTNESLFHTGWFVESLATQTLVVFVIRTAANPLKSRPSRPLLISVLAIVAVATVLPYTPLGKLLRFTPLPVSLLAAIAFLAVTYLFVVQAVKTWFYRRHALL